MQIIKRDGRREAVEFDKILKRVQGQCKGLDPRFISAELVAQKVIEGVYDGVSSTALDELASETAAAMISRHPQYSMLASRLFISSLHKQITRSFSETIATLRTYVHPETKEWSPLISEEMAVFVAQHAEALDALIDPERDFRYDYFGVRTLQRGYLMRMNGKVVETPQMMLLRIATAVQMDDLATIADTYERTSLQMFSWATPTMFNAGTPRPQMSSCYLVDLADDSINGIYETLHDCAQISKWAGGIGLAAHGLRAKGSYIRGTGGYSNGIVPMLRVFNETARYVDQGGGRRKGSIAIYLEPWHADIEDFLELRKNQGKEEHRTRDLFTALWCSDLFFERVMEGGDWPLFSADECPDLHTTHGAAHRKLFLAYEAAGKARKVVKAQQIWHQIVDSQLETGTPYILNKDACNLRSNQTNLGTIKSSNLCAEIVEFSSDQETAVCNLASMCLAQYVVDGQYDFDGLRENTYHVAKALNRIIDLNYYPTGKTQRSNRCHRPIGIGVNGLADTFAKLKLSFDSPEARRLNAEIFETMYFAALSASADLAQVEGRYSSFDGSPLSDGLYQFDLSDYREVSTEGGKLQIKETRPVTLSGRWDFDALRKRIMATGVRNSLSIALMPTASSASISGFNESFEPFTSNLFKRNTLSGEYTIINRHLVGELIELGLWDSKMLDSIIAGEGSVQHIDSIPAEVRLRYRTVYEIPQRSLIDMAADRGAFVCQSQSFNLHIAGATRSKVSTSLLYGWLKGNKTICYYMRSKSVNTALKGLGREMEAVKATPPPTTEQVTACSLDNPDNCDMCSA